MKKPKREPWRIVVGFISVAFILFMWVKKDIGAIYTTMPQEQLVPMLVTSIVVTVVKVAVIAGALFLIKWLVGKFKNK